MRLLRLRLALGVKLLLLVRSLLLLEPTSSVLEGRTLALFLGCLLRLLFRGLLWRALIQMRGRWLAAQFGRGLRIVVRT